MPLLFVLALWVFAAGLIVFGALNKTVSQLIQNRVDEFKPSGTAKSASHPVRLMDVPRKAREPLLNVILSTLNRVGEPLTGFVPSLGRIEANLVRAGRPYDLTSIQFLGVQGIVAGIGFILPLVLASPIAKMNPSAPLILAPVVAMMGWTLPTLWLNRTIKLRMLDMKVALPDLLDLIILSMDAGIGFDGALGRAIEKTKGPLTQEMQQALNEINHGKTRAEAFRDLAARAKIEGLSLLLASINQSEQLGTSIGSALRIQAHEIRRRRTQQLREMAAKLPVKMLIPLVLCIFPALLMIILGPAAIMLLRGGLFGQ